MVRRLLGGKEDDVEVDDVFVAGVVERGIDEVESGVRVEADPAAENSLWVLELVPKSRFAIFVGFCDPVASKVPELR